MFQVLVSHTFQKQFNDLSKDMQKRIRKALNELGRDPINPRSGVDIKPLQDTNPQKHRIRVGEYRLIYRIEGTKIKMIEITRYPRKNMPSPIKACSGKTSPVSRIGWAIPTMGMSSNSHTRIDMIIEMRGNVNNWRF